MAKKPPAESANTTALVEAKGETRGRAFRPIPIRFLLPNLLTLIALCSGVTAIRFVFEAKLEFAVGAIILATFLDALDGRLARYLEGTSRFGAELDSLADFVNFGVAPAILIYVWSLNGLHTFGWAVCLVFAICCALRLARFNVALDTLKKPGWTAGFFSGLPAPAGALLSLAPIYLGFLGIINEGHSYARVIAAFELCVAGLMISRVPTFSGKSFTRVPREYALPLLALMACFIVFLVSFPWETLSLLALFYIVLIPVSYRQYRRLKHAQSR